MSKALTVLKVFFSLVSINSTENPSSVSPRSTSPSRSTVASTKLTPTVFQGSAHVGQTFRIPIPQETVDAVNCEIKHPPFTMKTSNNGKILQNSWIQFDVKSREVYGFPLPGNVGKFSYKIVVDRVKGDLNCSEIIFELRVKKYSSQYSHELILTTGTNYHRFMTNLEMRIDFVTKLARYCFNEKPAKILVKSFDKSSRNITIVFVNIPNSPCIKDIYSELRSRILDEETNIIEKKLQNALTSRFPIESAHFKFFAPCDPNLFGPDPPFQWGWWKHFIPLAILLFVVGFPVTISCLVKRRKRPVVQEERTPRTLRRRNEDGTTDFTSHTVHFNNRYPSMLSVSNNSKEDGVGEDEKGHGGKANIPNGSPSSRHLTVPNTTGDRPRQGTAAASDKTKHSANQNNPFKFPFNMKDRASFNVRAMWDDDDDDDTERPALDIPVYYTYRNNEEEEPSMLDAVLDMNFSDIADNISTKLKGVKSMLNISQTETSERQEATKPFGESSASGLSLSSKLKDLGKSVLNISAPTNESAGATFAEQTTLPSLSTKLRDFGKSMLNISIGAQSDDKKDSENSREREKTSFDDSDDSESYIYKPREYEDARIERQRYDDARRLYDFTKDDRSVHRQSICRQSNASEYELSQYIPARRHSSSSDNQYETLSRGRRHCTSSDYHQRTQEHFDNYDNNFGGNERRGNRRRTSRESDFDEYPDSLFDASSEQGPEDNFDLEKSIFDTDFEEEQKSYITKPTPIWNHVSAVKSLGSLGIESFPLNKVKYQDYTNPHQYTNGRVPHGKPSYSVLGSNNYSSQSTLDFWDDDEYERKSSWKDSFRAKDDFFTSFNTSVPDLRHGKSKGGIPNGTKPQSKSKASQGKSLLPDVGSLFSRDARSTRDTREKPPVVFTLGGDDEEEEREQEMERDNSMVDLIKTKVSSLLEPDGNISKWFPGFNKNDNPIT